jgi:hypothetical protein
MGNASLSSPRLPVGDKFSPFISLREKFLSHPLMEEFPAGNRVPIAICSVLILSQVTDTGMHTPMSRPCTPPGPSPSSLLLSRRCSTAASLSVAEDETKLRYGEIQNIYDKVGVETGTNICDNKV